MPKKKFKFTGILVITFLLFVFSGCDMKSQTDSQIKAQKNDSTTSYQVFECKTFIRDSIRVKLQKKINNSQPLFVHIFVPLCDDIHQGIVPTNSSLGDGMNLKTNLYWGAGYGIKTHFKRQKDWKLIKDTLNIDSNILERVVFYKTFSNSAKVYIIADAYRGDRMPECLTDYFNSLAGINKSSISIGNEEIMTNGNADFLIFNGHNGLMDVRMPIINTIDGIQRDAAVIACASKSYFIEYFKCTRSYPLITTNDLLPPEAYVAKAIINSWALMKTDNEIRISASDAMATVHHKSKKAMHYMFSTGW